MLPDSYSLMLVVSQGEPGSRTALRFVLNDNEEKLKNNSSVKSINTFPSRERLGTRGNLESGKIDFR